MEKGPLDKQTEELLTAYFRGELEGLELQRVEAWLAESEEHRQQYRRISADMLFWQWSLKEWKLDSSDAERRLKAVWNRKPGLSWKRYLTIAASVVILLFAGWWGFRHVDKNTEIPAEVFAKIEPITPRAVLVLSSGKQIDLAESHEQITEQNGMIVEVDSSGEIRYQRTDLQSEEIIYNKVIVPRSGEYFVTLCDGSKVWLNADTEFEFPVNFSETIREVRLKGEAYFQVAKDCQKPFIVKSGEYQLQVYGTEFNLNTYHTDRIEAVLVKGSIGFRANAGCKEIVLQPEQLGIANTGNGKTEVLDVDVYPYIAWKSKDMVFVNERLESIMEKIERWYDVNVFFQNERLKDLRFYGDMKRYSDIREILAYLEKSSDVRFQVNGRTLIVCEK